MKKERRRSLIRNKRAVSPVIGVILMVAVTVVMAAIIMNWSSSITAPEAPKQCGITVSRLNPTEISITVTSREPTEELITFINYSGVAGGIAIINTEVMNDALSGTVLVGQLNSNVPHDRGEHLVVTCTWSKDGKRSVLYDARI